MPDTMTEYALVAAIVALAAFIGLRRFFWRAPAGSVGSPKNPGCGFTLGLLAILAALVVAYAFIV